MRDCGREVNEFTSYNDCFKPVNLCPNFRLIQRGRTIQSLIFSHQIQLNMDILINQHESPTRKVELFLKENELELNNNQANPQKQEISIVLENQ